MGFRGDLDDLLIHSLLYVLSSNSNSGLLTLTTGSEEITLVFDQGHIAAVMSADDSLRIGRQLVKNGDIGESQLEQALSMQSMREEQIRLGDILIELGLVTPAQIARAVADQLEEAVFRVLVQPGGSFNFAPAKFSSVPTDGKIHLDSAVLNAIRRLDESLMTAAD